VQGPAETTIYSWGVGRILGKEYGWRKITSEWEDIRKEEISLKREGGQEVTKVRPSNVTHQGYTKENSDGGAG